MDLMINVGRRFSAVQVLGKVDHTRGVLSVHVRKAPKKGWLLGCKIVGIVMPHIYYIKMYVFKCMRVSCVYIYIYVACI